MPSIILPGPGPIFTNRLPLDGSYLRDAKFIIRAGGDAFRDYATNSRKYFAGTPTLSFLGGVPQITNSAGVQWDYIHSGNKLTLLWHGLLNADLAYTPMIGVGYSNYEGLRLNVGNTNYIEGQIRIGSTTTSTTSILHEKNKLLALVVTYDGSTLRFYDWRGNKYEAAASGTPAPAAFAPYCHAALGGTLATNFSAFFHRCFTDAEAREFCLNPAVVYKTNPRILYFDVGGSTTNLSIQDATHAHAADAQTLTTNWLLAVADAAHAHTADGIILTSEHVLAVAEALHAHVADSLGLTADSLLAVQDAAHVHAADNALLLASRLLTAGLAAYTTTFNTALLLARRQTAANTAAYTTTFKAANLIYAPIGGATYTLLAEGAGYTTTFSAAQCLVSRRLVAGTAPYITTFRPVQLTLGAISNNSWAPVSNLQSPWGAVSARAPAWTPGTAISTGLWS